MVNGPSWTAEYDPERPQRSAGHHRAAGAVCGDRRGDRMRRREIAAHVWVHPPSRRTTVRIAEGGRKKLHHNCIGVAPSKRARGGWPTRPMTRAPADRGFLVIYFYHAKSQSVYRPLGGLFFG